MDSRFRHGETVRVVAEAPPEVRPGSVAEVCGIWRLLESLEAFGSTLPQGTEMFLIEFPDGVAVEVPSSFLTGADPDGECDA